MTWGLCTSRWVDGPIVWFSVDLCFLCVPLAFVPVSLVLVRVLCFLWCVRGAVSRGALCAFRQLFFLVEL